MTSNVFIVVKDSQGSQGVISQAEYDASGEYVRVVLADGQAVYAPRNLLHAELDGTLLFASDFASIRAFETLIPITDTAEEANFPVIVEEAHVEKAWRDTATVRVSKRVFERDVIVEELLRQETVEIERVPVNRMVEAMPSSRTEGDVTVIPVVEEVVVVEKRLMLKEEIRVRRASSQKPFQQTVTLREEQVEIDRSANTAADAHASQSAG